MILRTCWRGCGDGSRAIAGFFGGAAQGTEGKEAENPTKRDGRGGGLLGAVCDLEGSNCDAIDFTERLVGSSLSLDRLASSSEAFDIRCVVSSGDLSGTGGPELCCVSPPSVIFPWLLVPVVWPRLFDTSSSSTGAVCPSPIEEGSDPAGF